MPFTENFYYFAYGTRYIGVGMLADYKLVFCKRDNNCAWGHCAATASIEPATGGKVYGTIWELANEDMVSLDKQEGVPELYQPFTVDVNLLSSTDPVKTEKSFSCRTYAMGTEEYAQPIPRRSARPPPSVPPHLAHPAQLPCLAEHISGRPAHPSSTGPSPPRSPELTETPPTSSVPTVLANLPPTSAWSVTCESVAQRLANQ
ncbi:hypothetical protein SprV_0501763100 [Sparganum proliferum]